MLGLGLDLGLGLEINLTITPMRAPHPISKSDNHGEPVQILKALIIGLPKQQSEALRGRVRVRLRLQLRLRWGWVGGSAIATRTHFGLGLGLGWRRLSYNHTRQ